tara:strand:+ start:1694 stop:2593 length:900 start_codon:yes stop_codon:yes gene_type:complete
MYKIFGFYKFKKLNDLKAIKKKLESLFNQEDVKGSIIISLEGLNGSIAFKSNQHVKIKTKIKSIFGIRNFDNENLSTYQYKAFNKAKIKIKKEVVPIGIRIKKKISNNQIDPKKWNKFIKQKNLVLIDTRKDFEFKVGTFKGSINPKLNNFRDFPKYFKTLRKDQKIGMFCTGGIRCEKASIYLRNKGFKNVYQLKGGIINYLSKINKKHSLWKGDCFVFDNRVSLKHGLKTGTFKICPACREPIKSSESKSNLYEEGVSCSSCFYKLTSIQKERFRMRQKQVEVAKKSGQKYFFQREN